MRSYKKTLRDESKYVSIRALAEIILKEAGRPLSVKEITEKILKKRFIASKTPNYSVCAALQRINKIKRISRGLYKLA